MRIVSLNAWGGAMFDSLIEWLACCGADVLCLQEVTRTPRLDGWTRFTDAERQLPQRANLFDDVRRALPRHQAHFVASDAGPVVDGDGSVRFRYAIDFKGCELPAESIRRAILTAMEGVEAHADALMTAMTARTNTLEATVRISRTPEGGSHGTH